MLPRALRLTSKSDFSQVYRKGRRLVTRNLQLFLLKSSDLVNQNTFRFGFVVSKKHVGKIVRRNRIKRILRSLVSRHLAVIPSGYKYIISAKPGIDKETRAQIATEFEDLFTIKK
ncbi:MAG: ribonuclease P protein component [bacterium]|nr:ribonuclease P protein component [bacterium]